MGPNRACAVFCRLKPAGNMRLTGLWPFSAPAELQRRRARGRPGMTPEKFDQIQALQTPDAEKRSRAGFIIDRRQIESIVAALRQGQS